MYLKKLTSLNDKSRKEIIWYLASFKNFEQTTKGKYTNIDEDHNMLRPLQEPLGSWFEQSSIFDGVKLGM